MAEDEIQRERKELTAIQFSMDKRIHYLEEDKIKLVANNEVLNEKLNNKEREKDTLISMWQDKIEDASQRIQYLTDENKQLNDKLDSFKTMQLEREAEFIKENSEIMRKREISDNEWKHLREQLNQKQEEIERIYSDLENLRADSTMKNEKILDEYALKEKELNISNIKKIGKYKIDIENISEEKRKFQLNFISIQKEKDQIIKQSEYLIQEKKDRQNLTWQLFEYMKSKIIEKHEENTQLHQKCSILRHNIDEFEKENIINGQEYEST